MCVHADAENAPALAKGTHSTKKLRKQAFPLMVSGYRCAVKHSVGHFIFPSAAQLLFITFLLAKGTNRGGKNRPPFLQQIALFLLDILKQYVLVRITVLPLINPLRF